jgi:hypothetical protein
VLSFSLELFPCLLEFYAFHYVYHDIKQVLLVVQRSRFATAQSRACFEIQFFRTRLNSAPPVVYSSSVWQMASYVRRPY